jgi:hypothetical protein
MLINAQWTKYHLNRCPYHFIRDHPVEIKSNYYLREYLESAARYQFQLQPPGEDSTLEEIFVHQVHKARNKVILLALELKV